MPNIFALCLFLSTAAVGTAFVSAKALAASSGQNADELEELLDKKGDETEVETEQDYALPVPQAAEESSPTLNEADQGPVHPGERNNEDLFLPVPSDQVGLPAVDGETTEDFMPFYRAGDVRHDIADSGLNKPGWTLFGGYGVKTYASSYITGSIGGPEVGTNIRVLGWKMAHMPFALHALGAAGFRNLNDVVGLASIGNGVVTTVDASNVKETTFRVGAMLEWEITRRFQLYGAVIKYIDQISSNTAVRVDTGTSVSSGSLLSQVIDNSLTFGAGAEWDFYVIQHASLGLRAWVEPRYASLTLTLSAEPRPRHKNSLDFEGEE